MSRLEQVLRAKRAAGRKGLIVYLTAGYPDLTATREAALAAIEAGADLVELGIPFSDPIADGPVIQKAAVEALKGGLKTADVFGLVRQLRGESDAPLALMTYINTIISYGPDRFLADCAVAGAGGVIVPDLPPEEAALLDEGCRRQGVDLISFIAPTSSGERIDRISRKATGFLYCISTTGVTGVRTVDYSRIADVVDAARRVTTVPVAVGFGIGSPDAAREAAKYADAVIVGSAVVERLEREGVAGVRSLVASLRQALDEATL
jgi:tryptophan synthase alpha chain